MPPRDDDMVSFVEEEPTPGRKHGFRLLELGIGVHTPVLGMTPMCRLSVRGQGSEMNYHYLTAEEAEHFCRCLRDAADALEQVSTQTG